MNIKAEHLCLKYGTFEALKDVNFAISENKIYGLLGRNGAGKTSLLSLIASFRKPTSGSLTVNGEAPFENAKIMENVIFLSSKNYEQESSTIVHILKDVARYRPNFDKEYADYLIDRFKIDRKKAVKKFSKGMQSAVKVIIGLTSRVPVTIFDEVYLGMDAPSREIFYKELLEEQARHPRIFILSTHLVSEMDYLFDEVLILKKRSLLLQEPYDELVSKGATITGKAELVDAFIRGKKVLNTETLGNTKAATIFGRLSGQEIRKAKEASLEIAPVKLQDLFIHLTEEEG